MDEAERQRLTKIADDMDAMFPTQYTRSPSFNIRLGIMTFAEWMDVLSYLSWPVAAALCAIGAAYFYQNSLSILAAVLGAASLYLFWQMAFKLGAK